MNRQRRQEHLDFGRTDACRVALAVEIDKASNPVAIRLLGADAAVLELDPVASAGEQQSRRNVRHELGLYGPRIENHHHDFEEHCSYFASVSWTIRGEYACEANPWFSGGFAAYISSVTRMMLRISKIVLLLLVGLWGLIGGIGNFTQIGTGRDYVAGVLNPKNVVGLAGWQRIESPPMVWTAWAIIPLSKLLAAGLIFFGSWKMWRARRLGAETFNHAKSLSVNKSRDAFDQNAMGSAKDGEARGRSHGRAGRQRRPRILVKPFGNGQLGPMALSLGLPWGATQGGTSLRALGPTCRARTRDLLTDKL